MTAIMQATIGANSNDMDEYQPLIHQHGSAHLVHIRNHQAATLPTAAMRTFLTIRKLSNITIELQQSA